MSPTVIRVLRTHGFPNLIPGSALIRSSKFMSSVYSSWQWYGKTYPCRPNVYITIEPPNTAEKAEGSLKRPSQGGIVSSSKQLHIEVSHSKIGLAE